jgi:hypothetical protein
LQLSPLQRDRRPSSEPTATRIVFATDQETCLTFATHFQTPIRLLSVCPRVWLSSFDENNRTVSRRNFTIKETQICGGNMIQLSWLYKKAAYEYEDCGLLGRGAMLAVGSYIHFRATCCFRLKAMMEFVSKRLLCKHIFGSCVFQFSLECCSELLSAQVNTRSWQIMLEIHQENNHICNYNFRSTCEVSDNVSF